MSQNYPFIEGQPEYTDYSPNQPMDGSMMQSPPHNQYLSNEEFESLNKAVQLLRISQLRYIVQKFSIPASGNKTKLLSLVLSIFQSLRYDKVLIDILQEINNLLAQQQEPFANPFANVNKLTTSPFDPKFFSPPNPLYVFNSESFILGPIHVPPGQSLGQFNFIYQQNGSHVGFDLLFQEGNPQQIALSFELNGIPFEISVDDPYPQIIDVTNVLNPSNNSLDIKMINVTQPMMICLREYQFKGIQEIANTICGKIVDLDTENPIVRAATCSHQPGFPLIPFLSRAYATGNWYCPLCKQVLDLSYLKVIEDFPNYQQEQQTFYQQPQQGDLFKVDIDWDNF